MDHKENASQDKAPGPTPDEVTRRESFTKLGIGSLAVAGCGAAVFGYEFLSPNVLYEPSPIANLGKPDRFPPDSVTSDPVAGVYIIHAAEGLYALSATCTHLGCFTAWKPELGIIACPCHGSKFNRLGIKIDGPAPKPLPRLKVWVSDAGDLLVDRSTIAPADQFVRT
jgi:cytochrome b6-f complex iron-sulfur subunit